jgi:tetratricopeptide (TPR) repeat protein
MARRYESLAGRPHNRSDALYASALLFGPCPVDEALDQLDALDSTWADDGVRADLLAMRDRIDEARAFAEAGEHRARERGRESYMPSGMIESLLGNHEAAAVRIGAWCTAIENRGMTAGVAEYTAWHARELALAGRFEEADQRAEKARALNERRQNEPITQAVWRQASALAASHRGEHTEAETLAREALSRILETDSPQFQADAFCDLAEVLEAAGRRDEAVAAWHEALSLYERKGIIPLARRVRERLASLEPA